MRKNLIIYNGKQDTRVIMETFHKKSYEEMNSQSVKRRKQKNIYLNGNLKLPQNLKNLPKYSCKTNSDIRYKAKLNNSASTISLKIENKCKELAKLLKFLFIPSL